MNVSQAAEKLDEAIAHNFPQLSSANIDARAIVEARGLVHCGVCESPMDLKRYVPRCCWMFAILLH